MVRSGLTYLFSYLHCLECYEFHIQHFFANNVFYAVWDRICDICFCTYKYDGIADADETSFAAGIALQAYFEGRTISKDDMDKCLTYWRENISERGDPIGRKRDVCW